MAAPDPLHLRHYNLAVSGHRKDAERALRHLRDGVSRLSADAGALADAKRLAADLADLITHLSALRALDEVSFLTGSQDDKET